MIYVYANCGLPSLGPIPLKKNVKFRDGMGLKLGNGISPTFMRGGVYITGHPGENFLLLVCEISRAHEMHSQLKVTEMHDA